MDKEEKIEMIKDIINNKKRIEHLEYEHKTLSSRVGRLENDFTEHRKKSNEVKRTAWEAFNIATGNRDKVELNSHRIGDTKEKFDKIEDAIRWVVRAVIGLMITIVGTVIINYFFKLF